MYQWIDLDGFRGSSKFAKIRTIPLVKWIEKLVRPDDHVLDIGCNAGWHSIIAAQRAKTVVGTEIVAEWASRATRIKAVWEQQHGQKLPGLHFLACDVTYNLHLLKDITLIIAAKVLYHKGFRKNANKFMKAVQESPTRIILAQGHSLTSRGRLGTEKGMFRLFKKYGFKPQLLERVDGVRKKNEYPIVVARR